MGCRVAVLLFRTAAHDAGRKMMPGGTSPLVARRQSAISSLRANATIMVFRVLARLSGGSARQTIAPGHCPFGISQNAKRIGSCRTGRGGGRFRRAQGHARAGVYLSSGEPVSPA